MDRELLPNRGRLIMDLLGALLVCAAIGGLGFVLMTIWFKKYQDLIETQQEKSLRLFREALQAHTEELISRQQNLLEQQNQTLKQVQIGSSLVPASEKTELEGLKACIDRSNKVSELQIIAQLLPLAGQNAQSKKAVEFLLGFMQEPEVSKKFNEFLLANPGPFLEASQAPRAETPTISRELSPEEHAALMADEQAALAAKEAAAGWVNVPLGSLKNQVSPAAESAKKESEEKRIAAEAEEKRIAAEAEEKRIAAESEEKRIAAEAPRQEEEAVAEGGLFNLSDDDLGGMFSGLLRDDSIDKKVNSGSVSEMAKKDDLREHSAQAEMKEPAENKSPETQKLELTGEPGSGSSKDEEAAFARLFGAVEAQPKKQEEEAPSGLFRLSDDELGGMFDELLSDESAEKQMKAPEPATPVTPPAGIEVEMEVEVKVEPQTPAEPSASADEEAALARLFGGMEMPKPGEVSTTGLFSVSDEKMGEIFDNVLSNDSAEKQASKAPAPAKETGKNTESVPDSKFLEPTKLGAGSGSEKEAPAAENAKTREAKEAEARLFGNLFGFNASKTGQQEPLESSQARMEEEAERKRSNEEAEQKRIEEEAEKKRLAEEGEKKRLVQELANRVKEDSRNLSSSVSQAENKQLAMEAAERKLAALAAMSPSSEQQRQFEQERDEEARKLLEAAESMRPAERLDEATERLMAMEASGSLPSVLSNFDTQATVEQPFSEAFTKDGNRLFADGKYAEAEKHYRAALPTLEEVMGREHLAVVEILHKLGIIAMRRGKYGEAEETFQQALVRRVMALGGNHPDTVSTLNDLGQLYLRRANFKEAKRCFTEALDLRRSAFGDEHRSTAATCHDLGLLYMAMGAYSDASIMMERAFAIRKKTFGSNHMDTAQSKSDLGQLCLLLDKLPQAEVFLSQSLAYRKENLGEDHPEYADTLLLHAQYLSKEGKFAEAEEAFNTVLVIRRKALGERHPETAAAFNALGVLQYALGNYDEAKKHLTQALYIRKTTLSENHPETAASMHDFGKLCWKLGTLGDDTQFAEGMPLIEKSLSVRKNMLGDSHPDTLQSFNSSGEMLTSLSSAAEAEPMLRATLVQRKELFGLNHLSVAETDHSLAVCLIQMGRIPEAKPFLEEELQVRAKVLGQDNPLVSNAKQESEQLLAAASA